MYCWPRRSASSNATGSASRSRAVLEAVLGWTGPHWALAGWAADWGVPHRPGRGVTLEPPNHLNPEWGHLPTVWILDETSAVVSRPGMPLVVHPPSMLLPAPARSFEKAMVWPAAAIPMMVVAPPVARWVVGTVADRPRQPT